MTTTTERPICRLCGVRPGAAKGRGQYRLVCERCRRTGPLSSLLLDFLVSMNEQDLITLASPDDEKVVSAIADFLRTRTEGDTA